MSLVPFLAEFDEPWRVDAACIGQGDLFFLERGQAGVGRSHPAKKICAGCPVKPECLDYALRTRPAFGVWAGMTYDELKKYVQRRRREVA